MGKVLKCISNVNFFFFSFQESNFNLVPQSHPCVLYRVYGTVYCIAWYYCIVNVAADANEALREFLLARNPKQQHSATLESYMIKPIQRILKYPLLLQQLCAHTLAGTDEHHHLTGRSCADCMQAVTCGVFSLWLSVCTCDPVLFCLLV